MNVWNIRASISVTNIDIWTKFGTELKYHTINTLEWSNSHNLKIHDGAAAILIFGKMSITLNWIKISAPNSMGICITDSRPCGWPCDQKSKPVIRVTSSNKRLKRKCVDLSDCNKYSNQIWFGTELKYHTISTPEWPNLHYLKIQDGGGRHLEFRKKCQ